MEPGFFVGSDKRMRFDSKPTAHVALAFQGAPASSEYVVPLQLVQAVLGSWDRRGNIGNDGASRWSIDVAEGWLAHRISSFGFSYKDTGLIGVIGEAPDNKLDDFMWHTLDNVVRICHNILGRAVGLTGEWGPQIEAEIPDNPTAIVLKNGTTLLIGRGFGNSNVTGFVSKINLHVMSTSIIRVALCLSTHYIFPNVYLQCFATDISR